MQTPIRLTFRHLDRSPALEARAKEMLSRLQRFNDHIAQCHMTIEGSPGESRHGAPCVVKIDLIVPGAQIHAENERYDSDGGDVYIALRDAFDNAKRQLLDLHRQQREMTSGV